MPTKTVVLTGFSSTGTQITKRVRLSENYPEPTGSDSPRFGWQGPDGWTRVWKGDGHGPRHNITIGSVTQNNVHDFYAERKLYCRITCGLDNQATGYFGTEYTGTENSYGSIEVTDQLDLPGHTGLWTIEAVAKVNNAFVFAVHPDDEYENQNAWDGWEFFLQDVSHPQNTLVVDGDSMAGVYQGQSYERWQSPAMTGDNLSKLNIIFAYTNVFDLTIRRTIS